MVVQGQGPISLMAQKNPKNKKFKKKKINKKEKENENKYSLHCLDPIRVVIILKNDGFNL